MNASSAAQRDDSAKKKSAMPCGVEKCLNCHGGCGAKSASYILDGLDFDPTPADSQRD